MPHPNTATNFISRQQLSKRRRELLLVCVPFCAVILGGYREENHWHLSCSRNCPCPKLLSLSLSLSLSFRATTANSMEKEGERERERNLREWNKRTFGMSYQLLFYLLKLVCFWSRRCFYYAHVHTQERMKKVKVQRKLELGLRRLGEGLTTGHPPWCFF